MTDIARLASAFDCAQKATSAIAGALIHRSLDDCMVELTATQAKGWLFDAIDAIDRWERQYKKCST